jgi:hypothetical protein
LNSVTSVDAQPPFFDPIFYRSKLGFLERNKKWYLWKNNKKKRRKDGDKNISFIHSWKRNP